jgi:hypothetical protein
MVTQVGFRFDRHTYHALQSLRREASPETASSGTALPETATLDPSNTVP